MSEYVYILTHPRMPGLIKIGRAKNVEERMKTLSRHSGVPESFECYYSCPVADGLAVENRMHEGLAGQRVKGTGQRAKGKEFFKFNPEFAKYILMKIRNTTSSKKNENIGNKKPKRDSNNKRASAFRFLEVNISPGSEISLKNNPKIKAIVFDDRRVKYQGKVIFLSPLTKELLNLRHTPQGPAYWVYKGQVLAKMEIRHTISSKKNKKIGSKKPKRDSNNKRASVFRFSEVGIPFGSEISLKNNPKIKATVYDDRRVRYQGKVVSLSPLTKDLLNLRHTPQGPAYWVYKGQVLAKMRS